MLFIPMISDEAPVIVSLLDSDPKVKIERLQTHSSSDVMLQIVK